MVKVKIPYRWTKETEQIFLNAYWETAAKEYEDTETGLTKEEFLERLILAGLKAKGEK